MGANDWGDSEYPRFDAVECQKSNSRCASYVMAEFNAIINVRPIVPVSRDCENPEVLSPSVLLTQTFVNVETLSGDLEVKLYKDQWGRVQFLADQFWGRWRKVYLQILQKRMIWNCVQNPNAVGDIVLSKDISVARNNWPMGLISQVYPSEDGRIRKVEVTIVRDGKA